MPSPRPTRTEEAPLAQHRAGIHRYVRSLVRDPRDAEDLTQEILLRALRQLGTLRDPGALGSWLRRIALNTCTDFLREASRRGAPERRVDEDEGGLAGEPDGSVLCGPKVPSPLNPALAVSFRRRRSS